MADFDYYEILGLSRNASETDIKNAFRKLSKKYHPDVCKEPDGEEMFKKINEAYSVLSDPEKKRNYDIFGSADGKMGNGYDPFKGYDPFMNPFGVYEKGKIKERGQDLRITIDLSFDEIYKGVYKKIRLNKKCTCHRCNGSGSESNSTTTCQKCGGTGMVTENIRRGNMLMQNIHTCPDCKGTGSVIKDPCPNCKGSGLEDKTVDVDFNVPAGMFANAYFVVENKGNDGPHRGITGDLLVCVREKPNDYGLTRDEYNNILYKVKLPYKTMVFGGDIKLPFIADGNKKIHISPGTESGKVLRLAGQGFPNPNNPNVKGDFLITAVCDIPKPSDLTDEQKKKIKSL